MSSSVNRQPTSMTHKTTALFSFKLRLSCRGRMTHCLYNSITLQCFGVFNASGSPGTPPSSHTGNSFSSSCRGNATQQLQMKHTGREGGAGDPREHEQTRRRREQSALMVGLGSSPQSPGGSYLQWCALSGFMLQHLGHLYTTCPGLSCRLSINSLVAFPLGTAP